MIGTLTDAQIEHLVRSQVYGRLCCGTADRLYMVPLSYVYDGNCIYCHSKEGMKIDIMRKHPKVCFQVDEISDLSNWWSILLWAEYEELGTEPLKSRAMDLLNDRFTPLVTSEAIDPSTAQKKIEGIQEKPIQPIVFRLKVVEKSGRFEKSSK